jgi:hypothetical protein
MGMNPVVAWLMWLATWNMGATQMLLDMADQMESDS